MGETHPAGLYADKPLHIEGTRDQITIYDVMSVVCMMCLPCRNDLFLSLFGAHSQQQ